MLKLASLIVDIKGDLAPLKEQMARARADIAAFARRVAQASKPKFSTRAIDAVGSAAVKAAEAAHAMASRIGAALGGVARSAASAGTAVLRFAGSALSALIAGAREAVAGLMSMVGSLVKVGSVAVGGALTGVGGFLAYAVSKASDLEETLSKVDQVFGAASAGVKGTAQELAKSFGLNRGEILDAAAGIGLIGKAAGQSQRQAAEFASKMAKLAADARSMYNVPLGVALEKIKSGLVGESEPLRAFGVLLNEDAVANEALAMGLAKTRQELTEGMKVQARASLIAKGLKDASGDLERTSGSLSNQWIKLTGTLGNMVTEIGEAVLPGVRAMVVQINGLVDGMRAPFDRMKAWLSEWSNTIAVVFRNLGPTWEIVKLKAQELAANVGIVFQTMGENARRFGSYIAKEWRNMIVDGLTGIGTAFVNLSSNLAGLTTAFAAFGADPLGGFQYTWKPLLDGFQAQTAALPEMLKPRLVSMQDEIDKVARRIQDREGQLAANAPKPGDGKGGEAKQPAPMAKADKFRSRVLGAADFAISMRSTIFSEKDGTPKQQLNEQKKIAKGVDEVAALLRTRTFGLA